MTDQTEKFKGKYRIPSNRLRDWDYSSPGYYFITLCTRERKHWFGEINSDQLIISRTGEIAHQNLEKIPTIYNNIQLDAWVIMPNHIHAIVVIVETPQWGVSTTQSGVITTRQNKTQTLGIIVNQFKSISTKHIRKLGYLDFAWQSRYYDHIIRNNKSLENIRAYILGNPAGWHDDDYFSA